MARGSRARTLSPRMLRPDRTETEGAGLVLALPLTVQASVRGQGLQEGRVCLGAQLRFPWRTRHPAHESVSAPAQECVCVCVHVSVCL